ncbi:hypothetical protein [Metabacillus sediminilitoris]|uniref:Uncharacterized protein n=1 Tax=Metabacillus sediminilitoris TaxID=2567941 RepID=A0A4S4C527_9BACI|nr:hypothetical protein [Metabacillus sediminilitoris]QGQ46771.1 hypothetical protein GMB29_16970 [Metabacillus sediminilitoris]THF82919.1 hypothetical protein E6W99_00710 [Metabacillus sediminilitoris]
MTEQEKVKLIQGITEDIIRISVTDHKGKKISEHEKAVELLARALHDFSVYYLTPHSHHEESLKGTVAKVKIAYNTLERMKKTNVSITRINQ